MDSSLYKTITSGNIDELKQIIVSLDDQFVLQMTPLKNTALHVAVQCNKRLCVEEICNRYPSLLRKANSKGNTPLHLAARLGFSYIVSFLIYCSKTGHEDVESGINHQRIGGVVDEGLELITVEEQLVRMRNVENDTALHEAVRNHQFEVVKLLTEADRVFEYSANNSGETPLYLAAEESLFDCVSQILQTCSSSAHGGPNGRTALHAAVMSDHSEITRILLEKKPTTLKESDDNGWTPLHYAAELNLPGRVVQLLDFDSSVAYLQDNEGKTALHIAASKGFKNIIDAVTRYCPDCWEVINNQGQNFLHVAAENGRLILIRYLLSYAYVMFEGLINEADNNGNTPLHLAALKGNYAVVDTLNKDYRVNKRAINKDNLTALDVFKSKVTVKGPDVYLRWFMRMRGAVSSRRNPVIGKDEDIEMINDPKEIGETHLLVATLIATMTFTAGFTLPGGYKGDGQDQGMAVLTKRAAFQAFVISDTIAMVLSTATVFIYFLATIFPNKKLTTHFIEMATQFTIAAIAAMVVAFMTGEPSVAFAAGFTLTGGYNSDGPHKGMAVLTGKPAFIAFVISNSTAMLLSTFAVFVHFWAKVLELLSDRYRENYLAMTNLFVMALLCTFGAIIAMVVAFVTGTYTVLLHLPGLAIPLCIFGCSFFIFCGLLFYKLKKWDTL